jgi:hypothetical protein
VPASLYTRSPRPYPSALARREYPPHFEVRLVSANGGIRRLSEWVKVSHVLGGQYVGLEEIDEGEWDLYFGTCDSAGFTSRCDEPKTRRVDWLASV